MYANLDRLLQVPNCQFLEWDWARTNSQFRDPLAPIELVEYKWNNAGWLAGMHDGLLLTNVPLLT